MGSLEHANWFMRILFLSLSAIIVAGVLLAQRGREMYIRRIPGLTAIEEAVGRATEMGRPIFFSPGLDSINIVTLQALAILSYIVRLAATHATRIIVGLRSPIVYPVAEESVREAYDAVGRPENFRSDDIRFVSDGSYSDEDGLYASTWNAGLVVDDIVISGALAYTEDFEGTLNPYLALANTAPAPMACTKTGFPSRIIPAMAPATDVDRDWAATLMGLISSPMSVSLKRVGSVQRQFSRSGVEVKVCRTCHVTAKSS